MKKFTTILFLLLPIWAFSQKNNAFDVRISPDFTYRVWIKKGTITDIGIDEKGKTGWHISLNYNRRLAPKLWLLTGLQGSRMGYSGNFRAGNSSQSIYVDDEGKLTTFPGAKKTVKVEKYELEYTFLALPITCRYLFSNGKISPFIELGVAPAFHIGGESTYFAIQQELKVPSDANAFSIFLRGSWGLQFKINETLNVIFQPTVQYQVLKNGSLYNENIYNKHLYSVGLEMGLSKRF